MVSIALHTFTTVIVPMCLCSVPDAAGQQEHTRESRRWTLEDCISHALEHNIEIKRQELSSETKKESLSEAKWSYAPSFSIGSSYSLSSGRVLDETTYDFVESETVGSSSTSISGNMDIFKGMGKLRELQRARLELRASLYDIESARYDLKANVTACYLEVLCAMESMAEAEQIVSMLEIQEDKIKIRVEAGKVTESDLLQIKSRIYSARNDAVTARGNYDMARLELCQLLEIEDFRSFEAASQDDMETKPGFLIPEYPVDLDWRPEIQSATLAVDMARKDLQIARSSYYPSLSLSAGYGSSFSDARQKMLQNPDGTFRYEAYPFFRQYADNASSYVSLSLNIPLFSSLYVRKNVRKSKIAVRDAEYSLISTRKAVMKEYLQARIDAQTAHEKYCGAVEQVRYAEEAARQITAKYESGAADITEYTTSVSELATARYQLLSAKYEALFRQKILRLYLCGNH